MTAARHSRQTAAPSGLDPIPADLDLQIAALQTALRYLEGLRTARDHVRDLRTLGQVTGGSWFTVRELAAHAATSPALAVWLEGQSPKAVGRRLRAMSLRTGLEAGDVGRVVRHDRTNGGTLWKIEIHAPPSGPAVPSR